MDFWEWLSSVFAQDRQAQGRGRGLKDSIQSVLSGGPETTRTIHPSLYGGALNPVQLDEVVVQANALPSELRNVLDSPFAQDTLQRLMGGHSLPASVWEPSGNSSSYAQVNKSSPDVIRWNHLPAPEEVIDTRGVLTHEVGHSFDLRSVNPDLVARVTQRFSPNKPFSVPDFYSEAYKNPRERFATAFQLAVDLWSTIQHNPDNSEEIMRNARLYDLYVPGTIDVFNYLMESQ